MNEVATVRGVERVQEQAGCQRPQAWAALTMCDGDVEAAIELARRFAPLGTKTGLLPSAEVLSMMYPACDGRARDHVKRVKAVRDVTGADLRLAVSTLQLCRNDVGEAVRMLCVW
jgi:N-acetylmuramic acid 6-phosphate (MurNAc-6-P) etherase